jgi:hypothetical protein
VPVASVRFLAVFDGKQYLPVVLCGLQPLTLQIGSKGLVYVWVQVLPSLLECQVSEHVAFLFICPIQQTSRFANPS